MGSIQQEAMNGTARSPQTRLKILVVGCGLGQLFARAASASII
jgi:2-polyprenyl-3-methyl-5-hydroxy-6-metoxy-1,4-benzoquinol methylase